MNLRHLAAVVASAFLVFGLASLGVVSALRSYVVPGTTILGTVMTDDPDPKNQIPISGAKVMVKSRVAHAEGQTDAAGFFSVSLLPGIGLGGNLTLSVQHEEYKPLTVTEHSADKPLVLRLEPVTAKSAPMVKGKESIISDVRIRYTVKVESTINSGTLAKAFEAVNVGGIPCKHNDVCSPDARWKAGAGALTESAPEDGRFANVRTSCIAGPCPFTRIDAVDVTDEGRTLHVTARTWSDTATFLVEADINHAMISDMVRQSYPVIFGPAMSFTLPGTAAGPSIEAEVNGGYTVFPLGPALRLSWAVCTIKENPDTSKLYSCQLKPGYRFQ